MNKDDCTAHRRGGPEDDDGELHEIHTCPVCGAGCDGDSPCLVISTEDATEVRS